MGNLITSWWLGWRGKEARGNTEAAEEEGRPDGAHGGASVQTAGRRETENENFQYYTHCGTSFPAATHPEGDERHYTSTTLRKGR